MKMSTATLIFAVAALAAPAAVGQSQVIPFESNRPAMAVRGDLVQVVAASPMASRSPARSFDIEGNLQSGSSSLLSDGPDPGIAWLMALGFLGLVVARRTRS
jgi:MYXO-CTERM domain-containing protein